MYNVCSFDSESLLFVFRTFAILDLGGVGLNLRSPLHRFETGGLLDPETESTSMSRRTLEDFDVPKTDDREGEWDGPYPDIGSRGQKSMTLKVVVPSVLVDDTNIDTLRSSP